MKGPTALKIFLSSPGDVAEEREALTKFIADFSNVTEKNYGIRLQVLTWEKDARRGPGRPQKSINELVDICDVYIGLMGKRFGGSTGVVQSGTYEEYISA
ncbi:MAG TPA: DUF4062 domain-containing protein, partial [bacterium]